MAKTKKHRGVIVPMITPFTEEGQLDEPAVTRIVQYLVENTTAPFVLGTTGEAASIPKEIRLRLVQLMCRTAGGQVRTYAGISGNSLSCSLEAAKAYFDLGVSAVVAHLPWYYPLTADQMLRYYEMLAEQIPGPLVLYNIKSTTNLSIPLQVVDELSRHERIVGIKDSERDLRRLEISIEKWKDRADFSHLTGWGAQFARGLSLGSDGIVPSSGNFAPKLYRRLFEAGERGDWTTAQTLQNQADEISSIYQNDRTLSQSLAALKVVMSALDLCQPHVLPPLLPLSRDEEVYLKEKVQQLKPMFL